MKEYIKPSDLSECLMPRIGASLPLTQKPFIIARVRLQPWSTRMIAQFNLLRLECLDGGCLCLGMWGRPHTEICFVCGFIAPQKLGEWPQKGRLFWPRRFFGRAGHMYTRYYTYVCCIVLHSIVYVCLLFYTYIMLMLPKLAPRFIAWAFSTTHVWWHVNLLVELY
jgi:hypothetical protein